MYDNKEGDKPGLLRRVARLTGYPRRVLGEILNFELGVARGHLADAEVRIDAALRARTPVAFLREQFDLLPETWRRIKGNYSRRQALLLGLVT